MVSEALHGDLRYRCCSECVMMVAFESGRVTQVQAWCWSRCVELPWLVREEEELTVADDGRAAAVAASMVMVGEEKN